MLRYHTNRNVLSWMLLLSVCTTFFGSIHGDEKRKGESKETVAVEKITKEFSGGRVRRTEYSIPAAGGDITVRESSENNMSYIGHRNVGFYTMDSENNQRGVWVIIRGPKESYRYVDIDGDGRFDELDNNSGPSILINDRWIRVDREKTAPHEGSTRTTIDKPVVTYVFEKSVWVKK